MLAFSSPTSTKDIREHPAVLFSDPNLWARDPNERYNWDCLLCRMGPFSSGAAQRHQDSQLHIRNARRRAKTRTNVNDNPTPYNNPTTFASVLTSSPSPAPHKSLHESSPVPTPAKIEGMTMSSPLPPSSPFPLNSPDNSDAASETEAIPRLGIDSGSSTLLPHIRRQIYQNLDDPLDDPFTSHGPRLPDDPPYMIYNNFSEDDGLLSTGYEEDPIVGIHGSMYSTFSIPAEEKKDSSHADAFSEGQSSRRNHLEAEAEGFLAPKGAKFSFISESDWEPWSDREHCLLDLLSGFPRAVWAQTELDIIRWLLRQCGVSNITSTKTQARSRGTILALAGADSTQVKGTQGHPFTVNSLKTILQHEFSNPLVRKYLRFYPDDAGKSMHDARHGLRWHIASSNLACPMARLGSGNSAQDFYVYEPCLAALKPLGSEHTRPCPVVPVHWFSRGDELFAKEDIIALGDFTLSYPVFLEHYMEYGLPCPKNIHGKVVDMTAGTYESWPHPVENPWRSQAKGHRCLSMPVWLYCDDTSGNRSKKWNKLNSWLFNLVGLPPSQSQLPYHIHFLATSHVAPPLEMLDEILKVFRDGRDEGIWAKDGLTGENVLLVPWAFGFEGDNPMQSEFTSHIGMMGTFFCRVCEVRGKDTATRGTSEHAEVERRAEFMKIGPLRTAERTLSSLERQLELGLTGPGTWSRIEKEQASTGVKDHQLQYYLEQLKTRADELQAQGCSRDDIFLELTKLCNSWPDNLFNPAFAIPEFDPHLCAPVEVLHVFLLGIVKYMWRDAVSRLNTKEKHILKTRLSSLDVRGLGLSPINGHTFVQYAGSLVGRDFRVIAQVGPSVLHGLIPDGLYSMWVAMCRLAPLVFQSKIEDLEEYLGRLDDSILAFLKATAVWNIAWFNKPKFHLLLHLGHNIRYFGPAIYFATESFESHNAIIRERSIHSNRQAPSRDIAHAFSYMHAIRHLVSGGWYSTDNGHTSRQAGQQVLAVAYDHEYQSLMGLKAVISADSHPRKFPLTFVKGTVPVFWGTTKAFPYAATVLISPRDTLVRHCETLQLSTEDVLFIDGFVALKTAQSPECHFGRVCEIICLANSHSPVGVLLEIYSIKNIISPYQLPHLSPTGVLSFHQLEEIVCAVHAFHNCANNACTMTRTRKLDIERISGGDCEDEYKHDASPNDLVLNLSQMRNASILQKHQPPHPLPSDWTIDFVAARGVAAQRERLEAEKAAKLAKKTKAADKRDGMGKRKTLTWPEKVRTQPNLSLQSKLKLLRVEDLKDILRKAELGVSGAKDLLIDRIENSVRAREIFDEDLKGDDGVEDSGEVVEHIPGEEGIEEDTSDGGEELLND